MSVLYLLAMDTREPEILTRRKRFGLATMYNNESARMVRGTRATSDSEAKLRALMRADRRLQKRRRDRQELIDLGATEEAGSAAKIERFTRRRP